MYKKFKPWNKSYFNFSKILSYISTLHSCQKLYEEYKIQRNVCHGEKLKRIEITSSGLGGG